MIRYAQRGSAIYQATTGDVGSWGVGDHLLALIYDSLQGANWQRGGGQGHRPEPFPRPGIDQPEQAGHHGADAVMIDDFDAFWAA